MANRPRPSTNTHRREERFLAAMCEYARAGLRDGATATRSDAEGEQAGAHEGVGGRLGDGGNRDGNATGFVRERHAHRCEPAALREFVVSN